MSIWGYWEVCGAVELSRIKYFLCTYKCGVDCSLIHEFIERYTVTGILTTQSTIKIAKKEYISIVNVCGRNMFVDNTTDVL